MQVPPSRRRGAEGCRRQDSLTTPPDSKRQHENGRPTGTDGLVEKSQSNDSVISKSKANHTPSVSDERRLAGQWDELPHDIYDAFGALGTGTIEEALEAFLDATTTTEEQA
jgi:hypothetical protein